MAPLTQSLSKFRAKFLSNAHATDRRKESQEVSKNIQTRAETTKASIAVVDITIPVQLEQLPVPGAFPPSPGSSQILCRRLADKHLIFTTKLVSLNESFQLGLEAQEILDPETAQATLLQYHHSTQKPSPDQNNKTHSQAQTVDKDHPFSLIHRALPHESLILASSLARKICLGSRLRTCLNRVTVLNFTEKTPPPTNSLPEHQDFDNNSSPALGISFWESRLHAHKTAQSSPGLNSSSSSAPSTPGCYSSLSSSFYGLRESRDTDSDYTGPGDSDSDFKVSPKMPRAKHSEEVFGPGIPASKQSGHVPDIPTEHIPAIPISNKSSLRKTRPLLQERGTIQQTNEAKEQELHQQTPSFTPPKPNRQNCPCTTKASHHHSHLQRWESKKICTDSGLGPRQSTYSVMSSGDSVYYSFDE